MIRLAVAVIFGVALWPLYWPLGLVCFGCACVVATGLGWKLRDWQERRT